MAVWPCVDVYVYDNDDGYSLPDGSDSQISRSGQDVNEKHLVNVIDDSICSVLQNEINLESEEVEVVEMEDYHDGHKSEELFKSVEDGVYDEEVDIESIENYRVLREY
ncbi:unnamed protein product [Pieris brassicae]|uniref:Uncharacterized protein n=1 Tax=Pieris brassicae TaxID=7116 RepID=A0A9P0TN96_PIEBR|nr:unnamed protein product [Pieris brassicae]